MKKENQLDEEWAGKKVCIKGGVYFGCKGIVIARSTLSHRSDNAYKLNGVYVRLEDDQVVVDRSWHLIPVSVTSLELEGSLFNEANAIKAIRKIAKKNGRVFFTVEDINQYRASKKKKK